MVVFAFLGRTPLECLGFCRGLIAAIRVTLAVRPRADVVQLLVAIGPTRDQGDGDGAWLSEIAPIKIVFVEIVRIIDHFLKLHLLIDQPASQGRLTICAGALWPNDFNSNFIIEGTGASDVLPGPTIKV